MACLLVPMTEAIIVTAVDKLTEKKAAEKASEETGLHEIEGIVFHDKVKWLRNMLWGGSALLAFEHVWHGEIVPWFPFLTATENPADLAGMLSEMSTVGVTMAALVTAVWGMMLLGANVIEKRTLTPDKVSE